MLRTYKVKFDKVEERSAQEGKPTTYVISGYAALFDTPTKIYEGYYEIIDSKAFDNVLDDDVRCVFNHDGNIILGRSKSGTLELSVDSKGLRFKCEMHAENRSLYLSIKRGDIDQCSFKFRVKTSQYTYNDDSTIRRIMELSQLIDVGPVTYPAYEDTEVEAEEIRSKIELKNSKQNEEDKGGDESEFDVEFELMKLDMQLH